MALSITQTPPRTALPGQIKCATTYQVVQERSPFPSPHPHCSQNQPLAFHPGERFSFPVFVLVPAHLV
jgi:hypothetical protein